MNESKEPTCCKLAEILIEQAIKEKIEAYSKRIKKRYYEALEKHKQSHS